MRRKRKKDKLTTTKKLVYISLSCFVVVLILFVYVILQFVGVLQGADWRNITSSNAYFSAYATLITQIAAVVGTLGVIVAYIIKAYMNKSGLEFIFNSERYQIDYKLALQRKTNDYTIFPQKELADDLTKADGHIDRVKEARIKKITDEDISTRSTL